MSESSWRGASSTLPITRLFVSFTSATPPKSIGSCAACCTAPRKPRTLCKPSSYACTAAEILRPQAPPQPYVLGIARNTAIETIRRQDRLRKLEGKGRTPQPQHVVEDASRSERKEIVHEALAALSPEHRTVVVLRYTHGLKLREVAEILSCTPAPRETACARPRCCSNANSPNEASWPRRWRDACRWPPDLRRVAHAPGRAPRSTDSTTQSRPPSTPTSRCARRAEAANSRSATLTNC